MTVLAAITAVKLGATLAAAVCWFVSSRVALTHIDPGIEELDKVTWLASDLRWMGKWNCGAAVCACVAAAAEAVTTMIM